MINTSHYVYCFPLVSSPACSLIRRLVEGSPMSPGAPQTTSCKPAALTTESSVTMIYETNFNRIQHERGGKGEGRVWGQGSEATQQCTLYIHTNSYLSIQKNKSAYCYMDGPKGVCHMHYNIHCLRPLFKKPPSSSLGIAVMSLFLIL